MECDDKQITVVALLGYSKYNRYEHKRLDEVKLLRLLCFREKSPESERERERANNNEQ